VCDRCRAAGLPVAVAMAGGYGREVGETVALHLQTIAEAKRCWELWRAADRIGVQARPERQTA
jgi:hypothetical protein